jgi:hypothetical protein
MLMTWIRQKRSRFFMAYVVVLALMVAIPTALGWVAWWLAAAIVVLAAMQGTFFGAGRRVGH